MRIAHWRSLTGDEALLADRRIADPWRNIPPPGQPITNPIIVNSGPGPGGTGGSVQGFSSTQWAALEYALQQSLVTSSGGTGNISAPASGVLKNFAGQLVATGQFTSAEIQQIMQSITLRGTLSDASASGVYNRILASLSAFSPANNPTGSGGSGTGAGATDPILGLLESMLSGQQGATPTAPTAPTDAGSVVTSATGPNPLPAIGLAAVGGIVIYFWWKNRRHAAAPEHHAA